MINQLKQIKALENRTPRSPRIALNPTSIARRFMFLMFIGFAFACSKSSENSSPFQYSNYVQTIGSETVTSGVDSYDVQYLKFSRSEVDTSYWQFVKARGSTKGAIIYSIPYTGMDWSGDPKDLYWSSNSAASAGYFGNDIYGPQYDSLNSKPIFYQLINKSDMALLGFSFLYNGYDVIYVYHRFYVGRSPNDYVQDLNNATNWYIEKHPNIPVGMFGMSLG